MPISIALDGPSGAGKSTIAKAVAERIGAMYLDTGAMYRTVGLHMVRKGVSLADTAAVVAELPSVRVRVAYEDGRQQMYLGEENVSEAIRAHEISAAASAVSAIPAVRRALVPVQREIAGGVDIIVDGRDIGTVVLPDASVKIFLTADPAVRAQRRRDQLIEKNGAENVLPLEKILEDIIQRDYNDTHREDSPLKKAEDAVEIDTTAMDIETCTAKIVELAEQARSK